MPYNNKGKNNPMYGKRHTEETKIILSEMFKGKHHSPKTEFKKGHKIRRKIPPIGKANPFYGKHHTENTKKKISLANNGKIGYWKGKKNLFLSEYNIKYKSIQMQGKNNPKWKGGITPENESIRKSKKYKVWQKSVFRKDHFTCQKCKKHGSRLEAHHIKPFAKYSELRFDINNGITLCKECHYAI